MEAFQNLKNTAQRIFVRTGMLGSVVGVGAMAIAQLQHDHLASKQKEKEVATADAGQVPVSPIGSSSSENGSAPAPIQGGSSLAPWGTLPAAGLSAAPSGSSQEIDLSDNPAPVHDAQVQPTEYQIEPGASSAPDAAPHEVTSGSDELPQPLPATGAGELPPADPTGLEAQPVGHDELGAEAGAADAASSGIPPAAPKGTNPFRSGGASTLAPTETMGTGGSAEPPLLEPMPEHPSESPAPQEMAPSSGGFPAPSGAAASPPPADVTDAPYDPLAPRSVPPTEEPTPESAHEPTGHAAAGATAFGVGALGAGAAAAAISNDRAPAGLEDPLPTEPGNAADASHSASVPADGQSGGGAFPDYGNQLPTPPLQSSPTEPAHDSGSGFPGSAPTEPIPGDSSSANLASRSISTSDPSRGRPGPRELEGPQTASVVIHKKVPEEIRFGQTAVMEIHVKNVGPITADNVTVRDQMPEGAQLVQTVPQAQADVPGELVWNLGSMRPGEELVVREEIQPTQEGPIGSVATVSFNTAASARSRATRPLLKLKHTAPQTVLAGQPVKFTIELSNPGSGTATNVTLEEDVPEGLTHSSGSQIEYKVGNIAPQTTRRLELTLKATRAGMVNNLLVARADGDLVVEDQANLEVVAPQLKVDITGPQKRYLERKATFQLNVSNPGTADATNIDLVCRLPQGLQFVGTNNSGVFDPSAKTVQWSLARLPAGKQGKVELTVIPTLVGDHNLEAEIRGDMNLSDRTAQLVSVEGIPALFFGVADLTDPIEVGGQTRYEIRVVNQGTKAATNIQLLGEAPEGMRPVSGDGPSRAQVDGQKIVFEPLPQLAPKSEVKYYVTVDGTAAGHHLFRVRMASDDLQSEVTKEESTMVYSDR